MLYFSNVSDDTCGIPHLDIQLENGVCLKW